MMTWDWDKLPVPDFYGGSNVSSKTELMENETRRTYYFPGGDTVVLKNVIEVKPMSTGTHRVKTASRGVVTLHIIPVGWIHIEIKTPSGKWSF
ncbi:MAG: hypothetical protein KGL39_46770 [Patescibacteria group bacterium]|nr:hypothetical protein [Patescibacteria group bacterium]